MPRLRLFILWIAFVCVPLQSWAAATMAFCGPARPVAASTSPHDVGHGHGHERSHEHGLQSHHEGASHGDPPAGVDDGPSADAPHACGTCAACHAAALTGRLDAAVRRDLPPADLAEPALVPATRVPRVLDRPPRA